MEVETETPQAKNGSSSSGGDPETTDSETIPSECRSASTLKKKVSRERKITETEAGLKLNHRDKRKFHHDEDENQKKRKHEPLDGDTSDSYSSDSSSKDASPLKELNVSENEEDNDNRFSWEFWRNLHSCYASFLSYIVGFFVLLFFNYEWMLDEFADKSETYLASKTFVILFILFGYSGITMGLEIIQLIILCLEINVPSLSRTIRNKIQSFGSKSSWHKRIAFYSQILLLIIWCIAFVALSSRFWNWFWWNHICKSYHDRTCRNSWIAQRVIAYRDEACADGSAPPALCEKLVSYSPILIICVFYVFVANVVMPLVNDLLSVRLPTVNVKEEALGFKDIMNNLDFSKILDPIGPCDFSLARKNFNFGESLLSSSVDPQDPELLMKRRKGTKVIRSN